MGSCISREPDAQDEWLLTQAQPASAELFLLNVRFNGDGEQDVEAKAFSSLLDLASLPQNKRNTSVVEQCVTSFKALKDEGNEALLDLVVPMTTVMLHAASKDVGQRLWDGFAYNAVKSDSMLAHLFFWAFRCVADCPQASESRRKEAARFQSLVAKELSRKGDSVSPLVHVFDELHLIGDNLVAEKDRQARQKLLDNSLKKLNKDLAHRSPVPALLLVPDDKCRRPGCLPNSELLQVPEGGVLSSKARAPYYVLLEVDTQSIKSKKGSLCACRKRPQKRSNGANSSSTQKPKRRNSEGQITIQKGLFKNETWDQVQERGRSKSAFHARANWGMIPLIVKSKADDVRQEEMAYRLLKWFQRTFQRHRVANVWMRPFLILATKHDTGCLEAVTNAVSIDALKKSYGNWKSLKAYFEETFPVNAAEGQISHSEAISNFIKSMAAYSVICYVLSIRDRHNGNILLDDAGHVIHVDFGFMLCGAPGGRAIQQMGGFEPSGSFKLTTELFEVLCDEKGCYTDFHSGVFEGLLAVRKHAAELLALLQLSLLGDENSSMECFNSPRGNPEAVLEDVCDRLCLPRAGGKASNVRKDDDFHKFVDTLIDESNNNWRSRFYDTVQYVQNGIH